MSRVRNAILSTSLYAAGLPMAARALFENTITARERSPRAAVKPKALDGKPLAPIGTPEAIQQQREIRNATSLEKFGAKRGGFRDFGEFLKAVQNAGTFAGRNSPDVRLIVNAAPNVAGNESVGADGGFAVPEDFVPEVVRKIFATDSLLMQTDVRTTKTNILTIPKDETAPWSTTSGIQAAWEDEFEQLSQSKPHLTASKLRTNKLAVFVPVTDELLEDSVALGEHISAKAPDKINFAAELAIIAGNGIGRPKGIINSAGTVVVAEEPSQTAATIVHANVRKMWRALTPTARKNAIWLCHPDADEQLQSLALPGNAGDNGSEPLYGTATAFAPYGSLLGRPIYPSEACSTLGTPGDIIAADMSAYLCAVKAMRTDVSIHLWFDYDITAFRFVLRIAGQPWTETLVPSLNGNTSRGFFAMLAARS